ncbi:MAG: hypothetical protein LH606_01350 [Cytophagaceae bacterium]|nr:hypothetical protein [Cytophagaceae bacterium]
MQAIYHLEPEELNGDFLEALKTLFKNQRLTVTVQAEFSVDETERILANPAMKQTLERRLANVKQGLVKEVSMEEFRQ